MPKASETRTGGLGRLKAPSLQDAISIPRPLSDRVTQLIQVIQPSRESEDRRHGIANYVRRLIVKCFQPEHKVEAFMFGSVPLRTYLPDGDIDVSIFCEAKGLQDTWCDKLSTVLENEAESPGAEFKVANVSIINAEVKLLKCLVDNIVVDVSFNQIGGLCTLNFLEAMDRKIGVRHLFKRSIILIKAWCYYESRVLGAQHSLLSTYALETMVLYIFNVYHSELQTPLEVLYKFLIVFHHFEWDKFCLTLSGPVNLKTLDTNAVIPPTENGTTLLIPAFMNVMLEAYSYTPVVPTNSKGPGYPKYINIMDPLLQSNNLGRSVSKTSEIRIRNAFGHGARLLHSLISLELSEASEAIDLFFKNTWKAQKRPRWISDHHLAAQQSPQMQQMPRLPAVVLAAGQQPMQNIQTAGNHILELLKDQNNKDIAVPMEQENVGSVPGFPGFHGTMAAANGNANHQNNNFGGVMFPPPPPRAGGMDDRGLTQHPVHGARNPELDKIARHLPPNGQPLRALFDGQVNNNKALNGASMGGHRNLGDPNVSQPMPMFGLNGFGPPMDPCFLLPHFHQQQLFAPYASMKMFSHHQGLEMHGPGGRQRNQRDLGSSLKRTNSAPNFSETSSKKKEKGTQRRNLVTSFGPVARKANGQMTFKPFREEANNPKKDPRPLASIVGPAFKTAESESRESHETEADRQKAGPNHKILAQLRLRDDVIKKCNIMEARLQAQKEEERNCEESKPSSPKEDSDEKTFLERTSSHSTESTTVPTPVASSAGVETSTALAVDAALSSDDVSSRPTSRTGGSPNENIPVVSEASSTGGAGTTVHNQSIVIGEPPEPAMVTPMNDYSRMDRDLLSGTRTMNRCLNRGGPDFPQVPLVPNDMRNSLIQRPNLNHRPNERQLQAVIEMAPNATLGPGTPGPGDFRHPSYAPFSGHNVMYPPYFHQGPMIYGAMAGHPQGSEIPTGVQMTGPRPGAQANGIRPGNIQKPGEVNSLADFFQGNYQQPPLFRMDGNERRMNGVGNTHGWSFTPAFSQIGPQGAVVQGRPASREDTNIRETDDVLSGDIETLTQHLEVARNYLVRKATEKENGSSSSSSRPPSRGQSTPVQDARSTPVSRETNPKKAPAPRQDPIKGLARDRPPASIMRNQTDGGNGAGNLPFNHPSPMGFAPGAFPNQAAGANVMYPMQGPPYVAHPTPPEGMPPQNETDLLAQLHASINLNAAAAAAGPHGGYVYPGPHVRGLHLPLGHVPLHLPGHLQSVVDPNLVLPPSQQQVASSPMRPRDNQGMRNAKRTPPNGRMTEDEKQASQALCVEVDDGTRFEIDASIIQAVEAALAGGGDGRGTIQDENLHHQSSLGKETNSTAKGLGNQQQEDANSPRFQSKENGQSLRVANGHDIPVHAATRRQLEEGVVSYTLPKGTTSSFPPHRLTPTSSMVDSGMQNVAGGAGNGVSSDNLSNPLAQFFLSQPQPAADANQHKLGPTPYGTGSFIPLNSDYVSEQRKAREDRETQVQSSGVEDGSWNSGSSSDKTDQHGDARMHSHGRYTPPNNRQRSSTSLSNRSPYLQTPPRGYNRPLLNPMTDNVQMKQDRQGGVGMMKNSGDLSEYYKDYGEVANAFVSSDIVPRIPPHGNNFMPYPPSNNQQQGQGYSEFPGMNHAGMRSNPGPMHNSMSSYGGQPLNFPRGHRDGRWSSMGRGDKNGRDRSNTPESMNNHGMHRRGGVDTSEKWEGRRFVRDPNSYSQHRSFDPLFERFRDGTAAVGDDKNGGASTNPSGTHSNMEHLFRQNFSQDMRPSPLGQRSRRASPEDSRGQSYPLKEEDFPRLESSSRVNKRPSTPQSHSETTKDVEKQSPSSQTNNSSSNSRS